MTLQAHLVGLVPELQRGRVSSGIGGMGSSLVCTATDCRPLAAGNSNGMARSPSQLCWGVREFCSIASWTLICKSPRMRRCFICFAGWPLPGLWLSYPNRRGLEQSGMKELAVVALSPTMASRWRVDVIESSLNYREGLQLTDRKSTRLN